MDRQIVYPGQVLPETTLLNMTKDAMIGLGTALQAILGASTLFDGLACTPTAPASLQVSVAPGSVYALENIDGTAFSSLSADTTHQTIKQGIVLDSTLLTCAAPTTTGNSINYLIQAAYQDQDTGSTVLPYYNSADPSVAWNGPNNTGTSQNTIRKGAIVISLKAGTSATTGTQTTPAPDAGYTGLWVVTVANGATTIISGNISQAANAPFIATKLTALAPLAGPALTGVPTVPTAASGTNTNQVASTAFVQTAVGSGSNTAQPESGITHGRDIEWASNTTITAKASSIILKNSMGQTIKAASPTGTINAATNGANGLDTGSLGNNSTYFIWAIYNPTTSTFAWLLSLSSSAPTLPSGYTYSTPVSLAFTDGSSHFEGFTHKGIFWEFTVGSNLTGLPALITGAQGNTSTPTYVAASLAAYPTSLISSFVLVVLGRGNVLVAPNNNYGALDSTSNPAPVNIQNAGGNAQGFTVELNVEGSNFYYTSDGSASTSSGLYVLGFKLNI